MTEAAATKKGNALAITALVLSALFFLPLVPLIGLVLGIVALATGRSKSISIVAVCLGAFFTLMMGVYAAIAIPAFLKFIDRAKRAEATSSLSALAHAAAALDENQASELPDADWTPAASACTQPSHKYTVDAADWQREPWKTLQFQPVAPFYFQYRALRVSGGFRFEARADLKCDGHFTELSRDPLHELE